MTKYYRVAEHIFSIDVRSAWESLLTNYAPFEVPSGEPAFSLIVADTPYPQESATLLFQDSSDDDMPRIEVYSTSSSGWRFDIAQWKSSPVCCRLFVDAHFSHATVYLEHCDIRFAIDNAAMLVFAFRTVRLRTLLVHASAVVKDGSAQLFLGHSGIGKSTHARLWQQVFPDAWLLNDDNPVLRLMPDGEVRVYGSPWSGKTPCYKPLSAPVRAIVKLSQAPHNQISRLRLPEAYAYLLSASSGLKIVSRMMDELYITISQIVQTIPFFGLQCLPNTNAAILCNQTINTTLMTKP